MLVPGLLGLLQLALLEATAAAAEAPVAPTAEPSQAERQKLEAEFEQALGGTPGGATSSPRSDGSAAVPAASAAAPPAALRLIDLALDLLGAGGTSTATEPELRSLEGGGHDPKNRGFTVQNVELTLAGVVDPYLR
ncbi:MAG: hypothetical protein ABI895_39630, partial [Deltaproteobacteria bacterium]